MKAYNIKILRKLLEYEMAQLDDHSYIRNVALNVINAKFDKNTDIDAILLAVKAYKKVYKPDEKTAFDGPLIRALNLYDDFVRQQRQMIDEEMADDREYNVIKFKEGDSNG